ncbi:MAG: hypothetical protein VX252_08090 [Myxococcota bacterium]|nr:hypothetical protein [Myxococcota bacterium]
MSLESRSSLARLDAKPRSSRDAIGRLGSGTELEEETPWVWSDRFVGLD